MLPHWKPRIGLALGAGGSHGWAHIGVIRHLQEVGITPDIICGCSAGALVGAYHAAGKLDSLEDWVLNLTVRRTFNYMRSKRGRSLFGEKLLREMSAHFRRLAIEDLPVAFAAVATNLESGREATVRTGPLARAVAASGAFPLLFPPVKLDDGWAVDGCLVNPVPVSTCRALGADVVIAVRVLNAGEKLRVVSEARTEAERWSPLLAGVAGASDGAPGVEAEAPSAQSDRFASESGWAPEAAAIGRRLSGLRGSARRAPGIVSVMSRWRAAQRRRRVASAEADILIEPRLGRLSLGTTRALRAIEAGRSAAAAAQARLSAVLQTKEERRAAGGVGSVVGGIEPLDFPAAGGAGRGPAAVQASPAPSFGADGAGGVS